MSSLQAPAHSSAVRSRRIIIGTVRLMSNTTLKIQPSEKNNLLGCGSFVRGRKRKMVDSRPLLYYRGDYMVSERTCRRSLPRHQTNYPVSQSYIYQTPLVHDSSPATRTQSSIENLVPQTAPLLGTRCYLRNSSWIAR